MEISSQVSPSMRLRAPDQTIGIQSGRLELYVDDNRLMCSFQLCWMKEAEAEGWLELHWEEAKTCFEHQCG